MISQGIGKFSCNRYPHQQVIILNRFLIGNYDEGTFFGVPSLWIERPDINDIALLTHARPSLVASRS